MLEANYFFQSRDYFSAETACLWVAFVVEITSEIDQIFTCLLQIGHTSTDLDVSMRNQSSDAYITQFTISSIDMSISLEYLTVFHFGPRVSPKLHLKLQSKTIRSKVVHLPPRGGLILKACNVGQ